jgi:hypothetical protein
MVERWKEEREKRDAPPKPVDQPRLAADTVNDLIEKEVNDALNMLVPLLQSRLRKKFQEHEGIGDVEIATKPLIIAALKRYGEKVAFHHTQNQ